MFDQNERAQAKGMTVEDLITYMRNHFNMNAKVHVDGDNFFYFHVEEDGSSVSIDSSSLSEEYPEDSTERVVDMNQEYKKKSKTEVYSEIDADILKFRDYRHNISSDKFRDDFYRVVEINGWEGNRIEDKFNILKHDGFMFKEAVPIRRTGDKGRESCVTLLIFERESDYM